MEKITVSFIPTEMHKPARVTVEMSPTKHILHSLTIFVNSNYRNIQYIGEAPGILKMSPS